MTPAILCRSTKILAESSDIPKFLSAAIKVLSSVKCTSTSPQLSPSVPQNLILNTFTGSIGRDLGDHWKVSLRSSYDERSFAGQYFYTANIYDESVENTSVFFNDLKFTGSHGKFKTDVDFAYRESTDEFIFNLPLNEEYSEQLIITNSGQLGSELIYELNSGPYPVSTDQVDSFGYAWTESRQNSEIINHDWIDIQDEAVREELHARIDTDPAAFRGLGTRANRWPEVVVAVGAFGGSQRGSSLHGATTSEREAGDDQCKNAWCREPPPR